MKSVLYTCFRVKQNIKNIIKFELIYRTLSFFVFYPLLVGLERVLLIANANINITAYNAVKMLLNPLSYIVFFVMLFLLAFFSLTEQFALYEAVHASVFKKSVTWKYMLSAGIEKTVSCIKPRNVLMLLFVLVILPFASFMDVSNITKFFSLPGFIIESIDKYWYYKAVYYPLTAVLVLLYIRWFFTLVIMSVKGITSFTEACKESADITKGIWNKIRISLYCGSCTLLLGVGYVLCVGIFLLGCLLVAVWLNSGDIEFLWSINIDLYDFLIVIFSFVYTWFTTPFTVVTIFGLYRKRLRDCGGKVPEYTEKDCITKRNKYVKNALLIICAAVIFFSAPLRYRQIKWMMNTQKGLPMIMAHRGYSGKAPENTLDSMQKAIDIGVKAVEFDVQMTKDGEIVLLHDNSLTRTTGYNKNIWDVTYDEIKDLDASVGFRKEKNTDYAKTKIPTLDEVLKAVDGKLYCNIEIKRTGHDEGIEARVVDIIKQNDFLDKCDVTSQDYETLKAVKAADRDVLTAYTTVIGIGAVENMNAADIISIQESFANFREVQRLHAAGKKVFVWTVNEENTMEKLISLNVDAILTNEPESGQMVLVHHETTLTDVANRLDDILSGF